MQELYKKINNGEINIKYLSPIDLVKLEIYLESINLSLNDILEIEKNKNQELMQKKYDLKEQILLIDITQKDDFYKNNNY